MGRETASIIAAVNAARRAFFGKRSAVLLNSGVRRCHAKAALTSTWSHSSSSWRGAHHTSRAGTRGPPGCWNSPELQLSAPEAAGTLSAICAGIFCTRTLRKFISRLHRNVLERHVSSHLHQNPPEPDQYQCAPEPSTALSSAICYLTQNSSAALGLRNLISHLSAPRPSTSRTSLAVCAGTLQNLISNLHQNAPSYLPRNSPKP